MSQLTKYIHEHQDYFREFALNKAKTAYYDQAFGEEPVYQSWPENKWPIEADRYAWVWLPACPMAQRSTLMLRLLGLDEAIEVVDLGPCRETKGSWQFDPENPLKDFAYLSDMFLEGQAVSHPVLFDKQEEKVVLADGYNLDRYLQEGFSKLHSPPLSLDTSVSDDLLEAWNGFIFDKINAQIYRAAYEPDKTKRQEKMADLFASWGLINDHLANSCYLLGNEITKADLRLFPNLLRFPVYYEQFALNLMTLADLPHLWRYLNDLYSLEVFKQTTNLKAIVETHYHSPHNLDRFGHTHEDATVKSVFGKWLTDLNE